jgi:hypothetical protein
MIKNSNSHGFAHAFLVLGLIVALLGALGFIFWQNFIHKEPTTTKTETQVVKEKPKTENQTVVIAEEGIQFSVKGSYPKLSYKYDTSGGGNDLQILADDAISPEYPCQDKDSGYFISLIKNSKERLEELKSDMSMAGTRIGDNYWSAGWTGPCSDKKTIELTKLIVDNISPIK